MIFTTDDYWPYETMKKNASRLRVRRMLPRCRPIKADICGWRQVLSVPDLSPPEAFNALRYLRSCYGPSRNLDKAKDKEQIPQVLHLLGGRISLLLRAAKANDMLGEPWYLDELICVSSYRVDMRAVRGSQGHARRGARMDHVKVRAVGVASERRKLTSRFDPRIGLIPDHDDDVMDEQK